GHLAEQHRLLVCAARGKDFDFPLDRGILKPQIEASSAQRVAQAPLLVRTQNHERNRIWSCFDRPQFRDGDLPGAQQFEKERLEGVIDFVELVDQQYAWLRLAPKRAHERPFGEEIKRVQPFSEAITIMTQVLFLSLEKESLQRLIKFADGFLLGDSLIALQALYRGLCGSSDGISQFSLPAPWRALDQERLLHPRRQIHRLQRDAVDYVLRLTQPVREFFGRCKQELLPPRCGRKIAQKCPPRT